MIIKDPDQGGWCVYPGWDDGKAWRVSAREMWHAAAFVIEHTLAARPGDEVGRFL